MTIFALASFLPVLSFLTIYAYVFAWSLVPLLAIRKSRRAPCRPEQAIPKKVVKHFVTGGLIALVIVLVAMKLKMVERDTFHRALQLHQNQHKHFRK